MAEKEKIVLIDGHSILNRAFYGVPDLTNSEGLHTNAVYGFLNIMFKILEEESPDYLTVAFMLQKFSEDILYNRTKISDIDKKIRRFLISYFVDTSIKII